jgi:hypothetical protein
MNSDGAKKIGILIAGAMPPPGKLKKSMSSSGDEAETSDESDDESSSDEGMQAFGDMMDAIKSGDKAAGYDAFMDAMRLCMAKAKTEDDKSDESSDSYKQ